MDKIADLNILLKSMKPKLIDEEFVFCSVSKKKLSKLKEKPLLIFKEEEGITIILEKKIADANSFSYSGIWVLITLTVHSDLKTVGFLAAISNKLAKNEIAVNVISAYYHDHLFVPIEKADKAIQLLRELSKSKR